jgi:corrinoid protein of di/trimethylamine methyltransferase
MTHKERISMAVWGEMPDLIPYVPRIDIWYNANSVAGTLPKKHRGRMQDQISRAEGWALHKVVPEWMKRFGDRTHVQYHTPLGMVSTTTLYTDEMRKAGVTFSWIDEHIIKNPEDYRVVGYIFENLEVIPNYDGFIQWQDEIGQDGLAVSYFGNAASPMHHIQRDFLDATAFYYHYNDYQKEMRALAERVGSFFNQALKIIGDSPAEAILWGANFDDTITYPPYFEKEILPWIRKASDELGSKGKVVICHCDGENFGLMDLIRDSGMHVAEAICPYPMTRVKIEQYYQRWMDRLTIWGGIPSNMLLAESASEEQFEAYMDHFFKAVAPGRRMILGIADTTPPKAVFDRLVRIGERVEKEGRLPFKGGAARPIPEEQLAVAAARVAPRVVEDEVFKGVQEEVFKGNHMEIQRHVKELLDKGINAKDILQRGLLSAMEAIGEEFRKGELFVPEVLLSARAMNEGLSVLEPHLASEEKETSGNILIGTVWGDMHDIGKNLVITMLRGVGFEVRDMGVNVPTEEIVRQVEEYRPDILGLSALLTTTMPEMKRVIDVLEARELRSDVKVMVGGAPVNEKFAKDIGADGYAPDAGEAVTLTRKLMEDKG